MIYYFKYIRRISLETDDEQIISVYRYDSETKEIRKENIISKDGTSNTYKSNELIRSGASLEQFADVKNNLPSGTFVYTTKIKANKPLKRFLLRKDGKYIARKSDDVIFKFDDKLLSDEEKKYIIDDNR